MPTNDKRIHKIARIEDKATSTFLDVIDFPVSNKTKPGRLILPPSVVNNFNQFKNALLDAGAILPKNEQVLKHLLSDVAKSDAPEQWVYEDHVGWLENGKTYVTINGVIGGGPMKIVGINRSATINDPSGRLSTAGTWTGWRNKVAEPARHSSIMMLAICVALAAPLLFFVKRRSFMVNIFGKTRTGKTIATLVGASLPGIARVEDLITWRITDTRLEQRLPEYNDAIFPIDDLETMREKEGKEKYLRIRNIAYNLEQGWSMARDTSYTSAHGGVHEQWRCIAVTSYEKSIRDLAQSVNQDRQPGETLRLIDVPALFDELDHIFDRLPSAMKADDFQEWKRDTFATIAAACKQNHGTLFRKYIGKLIAHGPTLTDLVLKCVDHFVKHVRDDSDGDVARDVAQKFGLIYAGGILGIRYGLLPWKQSDLLDAISKCYFGARELLPDDGVALRRGINALKALLNRLPRAERLAKTGYADVDGFVIVGPTSRRSLIRREAFNRAFASVHERRLVLNWLIQKDRMTLATPKAAPDGSKAMPKVQHDWPDGERVRSYEIRWPRHSQTDRTDRSAD